MFAFHLLVLILCFLSLSSSQLIGVGAGYMYGRFNYPYTRPFGVYGNPGSVVVQPYPYPAYPYYPGW